MVSRTNGWQASEVPLQSAARVQAEIAVMQIGMSNDSNQDQSRMNSRLWWLALLAGAAALVGIAASQYA
jgi:hypothetical protein